MRTKCIDLIGIEFEGGWDDLPDYNFTHSNGNTYRSGIKTDGSLDCVEGDYVKEIVSPPMKTDVAEEWIRNYCPEYVNSSCGLHVHMSMHQKYYLLLTEERFWKWFQIEMKKLGESMNLPARHQFWSRLNGHNTYCSKQFNPWLQLNDPTENQRRYVQVNFNAWHKHKTVEFRVLSAFNNKDLACQAILGMVRLVEDYLLAASQIATPVYKLKLKEVEVNGEKDIICA